MNELETRLQTLAQEEETLIFSRFRLEDALDIGMKLYDRAKAEGHNIVIDISVNRRTLFHLSMDGCAPDNDVWAQKKANTVYRFLKGSYRANSECEAMGMDLFSFYGVDPKELCNAGGGFPITVEGVGCVGAIACGGMMPTQDHQYVVDAVRAHLGC